MVALAIKGRLGADPQPALGDRAHRRRLRLGGGHADGRDLDRPAGVGPVSAAHD